MHAAVSRFPSRSQLWSIRVSSRFFQSILSNIIEDELAAKLDGSSFLEFAETQGKTIADVRAFLIQQAIEQIDERLQAESVAPAGDETAEPAEEESSILKATAVTAPSSVPATTVIA